MKLTPWWSLLKIGGIAVLGSRFGKEKFTFGELA